MKRTKVVITTKLLCDCVYILEKNSEEINTANYEIYTISNVGWLVGSFVITVAMVC
jgi:hypothetical protein